MQKKKTLNVNIGETIQRARENANYTQEQLSEIIGLTPKHLSAIERGVSGASLETLKNICLSLHVSIDSLFFGDKDSTGDLHYLSVKIKSLSPSQRDKLGKIISDIIDLMPEE